MKKYAFTFLALVALARADVSIVGGQIGELRDFGGTIIAAGSIGILVADQSNNGLLNANQTTLTVGQFVGGGGDDRILGVYSAVDFGSGAVGFDFSSTTWAYSGSFGQGDNLYFLWFPTVSSSGSIVAAGVHYGQFRSDTVDVSSDIAWVAPADGTSSSLYALTSDLGGDPGVSTAQFTAALTTSAVPEPAAYAALLGVGAMGLVVWRKRRKA